jgi:hypothetical protein
MLTISHSINAPEINRIAVKLAASMPQRITRECDHGQRSEENHAWIGH